MFLRRVRAETGAGQSVSVVLETRNTFKVQEGREGKGDSRKRRHG